MCCNNNTPLQNLTAFAIVLAVGVTSVISFIGYVEKVKRDLRRVPRIF